MKKIVFAVTAIATLSLAGCIHVDADENGRDAIYENTEAALRVCGGEGRVKEVSEDGYSCITD
ncbi:hypothetical protein [Hyphomonas pacifica]|uniref:Lipoprotein n=1 Tax=Hyphomonas pacifica TaxID=1280941 RepID=A0A062U8E5_9PROT|nr:hypothetical protein [Hyphomonas pacifica]KCZ52894.1 hypothetical protein HY2_07120 [Hyphomonas pacifica]RAN35358.1 hypothetical protein HY3_08650 [Hyphomonas pacifica]RAN38250.1 hypothetical protein HY11_00120 [Hyphomonas pacifica]